MLQIKSLGEIIEEYVDCKNLTQPTQDAKKLANYALELEKTNRRLHDEIKKLKAEQKGIYSPLQKWVRLLVSTTYVKTKLINNR